MKTQAAKALFAALLFAPFVPADTPPALTIYNEDFAVVRERLPLDLKEGVNREAFTNATLLLEPDSVVLRDPSGKVELRILEQSYRADTLSQGLMLSLNEGKELDFLVHGQDGKDSIVQGKVVRSGYSPNGSDFNRTANYYPGNAGPNNGNSPIIEVDGKLRFSLPGEPLFPALTDQAVLKPTLDWQIWADRTAKLDAELAYVTGGLSWESAYNVIAPEKGDLLDIVGWVTLHNTSGRTFEDAAIKLMAGHVNKLTNGFAGMAKRSVAFADSDASGPAGVTEKAFDEYHLYVLPRPVTLHDRETKQVEFMRASGVKPQVLYVYDGATNYYPFGGNAIQDPNYGTQSWHTVRVMREFKNSEENHLGLPLPAGRVRFYRRDDADGRLEFTGENNIGHTPKDEIVRLYQGDAFDIIGDRKRVDFKNSLAGSRNILVAGENSIEESFEIKVRNHKADPVEVRVVEHLYRWSNWQIVEKSDEFTKIDAQTIEFRVPLKPDEEKTVTYRVHYDW